MTYVLQPFQLLVIALAGWLRHQPGSYRSLPAPLMVIPCDRCQRAYAPPIWIFTLWQVIVLLIESAKNRWMIVCREEVWVMLAD
jgi:hypothetical protein